MQTREYSIFKRISPNREIFALIKSGESFIKETAFSPEGAGTELAEHIFNQSGKFAVNINFEIKVEVFKSSDNEFFCLHLPLSEEEIRKFFMSFSLQYRRLIDTQKEKS